MRIRDLPIKLKDKVLLFIGHEVNDPKMEVIFWINLTRPDMDRATHAPYDNGCKLLANGEAVIALVKARVAKEDPNSPKKKRGVIVPFTAYKAGGMHWEFVRTADPEYKAALVKQLGTGDAESAIYNLISYPEKETADLIRPFLKDSTKSEVQVNAGKDAAGLTKFKTVEHYQLREMAFMALKLMGELPERPEGFDAESAMLWYFEVGFEDTVYFPYGDWKRLDRRTRY
jgi:hypothetical protein